MKLKDEQVELYRKQAHLANDPLMQILLIDIYATLRKIEAKLNSGGRFR